MHPRPTFAEVRSILQWVDRAQANKQARPQVFAASRRPPAPTPPPPVAHPPSAAGPPHGWRPSPNYRGKNPMYFPPRPAPLPRPTTPPPAPPTGASTSTPAPPAWRPPHDPWTGLVHARSMPWTAPSPTGAPPAYSGAWQPGMRPHTGTPRLLGVCPPAQAYYAAPSPTPYVAAPPIQYGALMPMPLYHADPGAYYSPMPYPMYAATPALAPPTAPSPANTPS
jgi:hypothetical protein